MTDSRYSWLCRAVPLLWTGGLLGFVLVEICAFALLRNLTNLSFARRWSLLAVLIAPLVVGYSFARSMSGSPVSGDSKETATVASAYLAILVITAYALLVGTMSLFL
jgi:hypothetical protein